MCVDAVVSTQGLGFDEKKKKPGNIAPNPDSTRVTGGGVAIDPTKMMR